MSVKTQNDRIADLEHHQRTQPQWVKIGEASQRLGQSCSNLRKKCKLARFRNAWKWKNREKTERLFHIENWKKAEGNW